MISISTLFVLLYAGSAYSGPIKYHHLSGKVYSFDDNFVILETKKKKFIKVKRTNFNQKEVFSLGALKSLDMPVEEIKDYHPKN